MSTVTTIASYIESTPGVSGGHPRIAGRRIRVSDIAIWHERLGRSADEIASEHDLTLAEVYAALAHYFNNREVIDQSITEDELRAASLRSTIPSKIPPSL